LLIQAIKAIGKESITEKTIRKISKIFSSDEKADLLSEAKYTTAWVYSIIKKICNGSEII